jgi:hypothetical protein
MNKKALEDFLSLVRDEYPHAKITRGDDFAPYEDYKSRYLQSMPDVEFEGLLIEAYNQLSNKNHISSFFRLTNALYPLFQYKAKEYLQSGKVINNRDALERRFELVSELDSDL